MRMYSTWLAGPYLGPQRRPNGVAPWRRWRPLRRLSARKRRPASS